MKVQKRGVLRNAYYLQDVVHTVDLIYVARLYGVLACSTYPQATVPQTVAGLASLAVFFPIFVEPGLRLDSDL